MREIEAKTRWAAVRDRFTYGLGTELIGMLLAAMVITFALIGYLTIRLHRKHLEAATLLSAERMSDVIKRSTSFYMLRDDRQGVYHAIATMANQPGVERVRIFDKTGHISYSTAPSEIGTTVNEAAEACYACHSQQQPLAKLNRPDRFRVYRSDGSRVLAIISPIENYPKFSNLACHAYPASQQIFDV